MYLLSALTLGFLGSLHCVGMCGPILLAFRESKSRRHFWQARILYNLGRTITYIFLGLLIGTFGYSLLLVGVQQSLSITLGIIWLLLLIFFPRWESLLLRIPMLKKCLFKVKTRLSTILNKDPLPLMMNAGIINGFLPCGLVYLALSGALASGTVYDSMAFMAFFGLGTFPAMLTVSLFAHHRGRVTPYIKPLLQGVSIIFACFLILRGMNLDIPYLSPALTRATMETLCQ